MSDPTIADCDDTEATDDSPLENEMTCHGCGGVLGRDCFNSQECEDICRQKAEMSDIVCAENRELADMIELAWGLIANAHNGDWSTASPEWKEAAEKWRDKFLPMFKKSGDVESNA